MTKSILDELYSRILDEGRGFSEKEILKGFFKIEAASEDVASRILRPLLKGDSRFRQARDRTWSAVKKVSLDALPIVASRLSIHSIAYHGNRIECVLAGGVAPPRNPKPDTGQ